jgi:hypothetical protein
MLQVLRKLGGIEGSVHGPHQRVERRPAGVISIA